MVSGAVRVGNPVDMSPRALPDAVKAASVRADGDMAAALPRPTVLLKLPREPTEEARSLRESRSDCMPISTASKSSSNNAWNEARRAVAEDAEPGSPAKATASRATTAAGEGDGERLAAAPTEPMAAAARCVPDALRTKRAALCSRTTHTHTRHDAPVRAQRQQGGNTGTLRHPPA